MITKKVCLITPGHIASNPRLIKEAISLQHAGFSIHIIFTQYLDDLVTEDNKILTANPEWTYDRFLWTPAHKMLRLKTALIQKFFKLISAWFNFSNVCINRTYYWQLEAAIKHQADVYIAHNLGALPVAVHAAKKNGAKCGFDAEDFHRNEVSDDQNNSDVKLKKFIEDQYLRQTDYMTAASPLISQAYRNLYPDLNPTVVNNVFEIKHQSILKPNHHSGLKLFWFSQTIGKNRGLEEVIAALNLINNPSIELHLLGSLSVQDARYFNELSNFTINYYTPISADQIFELANTFDIGLALEPGFCFNNKIALSNKIFTYLISGLAIIASDTPAQKEFMTDNSAIGELYPIGNVPALVNTINELFGNRNLLNAYRQNAHQLAKTKYNWEMEQQKFLAIIQSVIN